MDSLNTADDAPPTLINFIDFVKSTSVNTFKHTHTLVLIVQLLQLIGFVLRRTSFHAIFDLSPLIRFASFAIFDDFFPNLRTVVHVISMLLFSILVALLIALSSLESSKGYHKLLRAVTRLIFNTFTSTLFIPVFSLWLSYVPCGRTFQPSNGVTFDEGLSDCSAPWSWFTRISALVACLVLCAFALIKAWTDSYDVPNFRNPYALSVNKPRLMCCCSTIVFVSIFFLFHARYWLFRFTYLAASVTSYLLFLYHLPYFSRRTNCTVAIGLGIWIGTGVAFFIQSVILVFTSTNVIMDSLLIYIFMVVFSFICIYLIRIRYIKLETALVEIRSVFLSRGLLDSDNDIVDSQSNHDDVFNDVLIDYQWNPFSIDIFSRVLPLKFSSSEYFSTIKVLYQHSNCLFPNSFEFICLKLNFEISFLKDSVLASCTLNSIKDFDFDLSIFRQYLVFNFRKQLETLRRQQSTGQSVDSSSFLQLQRQQKQIASLHRDCLEALYAFWSSLSSNKVDLNVLPPLMEVIHSTKIHLNNLFQKVIHNSTSADHQSLLLSYSTYVREIECDVERAALIEEQAHLLSSSEKSSSHGGTSFSGSLSLSKSNKTKRKSRLSSFTDSFGASSTRKSAIKNLSFSIVVALVILVFVAIISFSLTFAVFDVVIDDVDHSYELNHISYVSSLLGNLANRIYINQTQGHDVISGAHQILKQSEHLNFHLRRLTLPHSDSYKGLVCPRSGNREVSPPTSEVQALLKEPRFPIVSTLDFVPPTTETSVLSAFTLGLQHSLTASLFGKDIIEGEVVVQKNVNGVLSSLDGSHNVVDFIEDFFLENSRDFFDLAFIVLLILTIVVFLVVFGIGFVLFARSFKKINHERTAILNLFLYIPKDQINGILEDSKFKFKRKKSKKVQQSFQHGQSDSNHQLSLASINDELSDSECETHSESNSRTLPVSVEDEEIIEATTNKVPLSLNLRLFMASIIFTALVLCFITLNLNNSIFATTESIAHNQVLAVNARSNAADITSIDRALSSDAQLFTVFGDELYLNRFLKTLNSGERQLLVNRILSLELNPTELELLGRAGTIRNEISYIEDIGLYLAISVFSPSPKLTSRWVDFQYNIENETNHLQNRLEFPNVKWYSSRTNDLNLAPSDRLDLAMNTLTNDRWLDLFMQLMDQVEGTADSIVQSRSNLIDSMFYEVSDLVNYTEITLYGLVLSFVIVFITTFYSRMNLGKGKAVLVFLALGAVGAMVYITVNFYSSPIYDTKSVQATVNELTKITTELTIPIEFDYNFFKRRVQLIPFGNTVEHIELALDRYNTMIEGLERIQSQTFYTSESIIPLGKALDSIANSILQLVESRTQFILIAAKLIIWDQIEMFPWLMDTTWNVELMTPQPIFANGYTLTNDTFDLALPFEERVSLCFAIVSSRFITTFFDDVQDLMTQLRTVALNALHQTSENFFLMQSDFNSIISMAVGGLVIVSLCYILSYLYIGSKSLERQEHVKQEVHYAEIIAYTKQYAFTLGILFLILLSFYSVSLFSFSTLREYPPLMSLVGERSSLVAQSLNYLNNAFVSEDQESMFTRAYNSGHELLVLQNIIVGSGLYSHSQQSDLSFTSNYQDLDRRFVYQDSNHGLHSLLINYASRLQQFTEGSNRSIMTADSDEFRRLNDLGNVLLELCLDAFDVLRDHAADQVSFFLRVVIIIFIVSVLVILSSYLIVFRKMLANLYNSERTTYEFLDMLPDDALSGNSACMKFVSENGY
ncbi:hypothetical protein P9112_011454 [Eukaryota sp. TZLM1-RC]